MTKNRVSQQTSLPVRSRDLAVENAEGNARQIYEGGHYGVQSNSDWPIQQPEDTSQYPMFAFGSEPRVQASYNFPSAMSPEMEFAVAAQYSYDGPSQDDILSTFMSGEIATSVDVLEDYPAMIAEDFGASKGVWPPLMGSVFSSKTRKCLDQFD